MCSNNTCTYTANKYEPKTWHSSSPKQWKLEQDSWDCPHEIVDHDEVDDPQYCIFHTHPKDLPPEIDEYEEFKKIIDTDIAADSAQSSNQAVKFIGARFGAFDANTERSVEIQNDQHIRFDHAIFLDEFNVENVVFSDVSFDGANFLGTVSFTKACFTGITSFKGVDFVKNVRFREAELCETVKFDSSRFRSGVDFHSTKFNGDVSFSPTFFAGWVYFGSAEFTGGDISFENSELVSTETSPRKESLLSFQNAKFLGNKEVSFSRMEFDSCQSISFKNTTFTSQVSFDTASLTNITEVRFDGVSFSGNGSVSFFGTKFTDSDEVSFESARFGTTNDVVFVHTNFSGEGEVSFLDADFSGIGDTRFDDSDFTDRDCVNFAATRFIGKVSFEDAVFPNNLLFTNADFSGSELFIDSLEGLELKRANFTGVHLRDKSFSGANIEEALFSRANLSNTDFTGAKIDGAVFGDARINQKTNFGKNVDYRVPYDPSVDDTDSLSTRIKEICVNLIKPNLCQVTSSLSRENQDTHQQKKLEANDSSVDSSYENKLNDDENSIGEDHVVPDDDGHGTEDDKSKTVEDTNQVVLLMKAARAYHTLELIGRDNSLPHLQTKGFVRRQEMHRKRYFAEGKRIKWLRASISRYTLLYGESPKHVISFAISVIVFSGLLYPLGGFREANSSNIIQADSVSEWFTLLPEAMYFSTLTFTTLGFGDFQPVGWGKVLAVTETALGATILALLVFVLGRRAAR